jgi:uncharacterized low-complexity protein
MPDHEVIPSRRSVLKRTSVAAAGMVSAGAASADSTTTDVPASLQRDGKTVADCGTEYDCWSTKCSSGYNSEVKRQCCEYDDGTVECEDWEYTGNCCL